MKLNGWQYNHGIQYFTFKQFKIIYKLFSFAEDELIGWITQYQITIIGSKIAHSKVR